MAVGLTSPTDLLPVDGVLAAACSAGIYAETRDDLALFAISEGATVSAVFTGNRLRAAPVVVAMEHLKKGGVKYLLINAGNANAGTGARGIEDTKQICQALAVRGACESEAVLPFSTGVIGEYLPVARIRDALPGLHDGLSRNAWLDCARAMMTTDTVAKGCSLRFTLDSRPVTVTGIAKGAGMIKPDMATMLAFIATDAGVEQPVLDRLLRSAVRQSFNRICVDGDTSTNDACVLIATGKSLPGRIAAADGEACDLLEANIREVCIRLAQAIVRDAEGATKFVTVRIDRARSDAECAVIAEAISTSPLVKTALYAADPNWGRILAAIGRSGVAELEMDRVSVYLNEVCIVENGARAGDYREEKGLAAMRDKEIVIRIDLNRGEAGGQYWTCDLSPEYVKINAEYRS